MSERTFYRYFPTLDDALLNWIDVTSEGIHAALRERPPGDSVGHALQEALLDSIRRTAGQEGLREGLRKIFLSPRLFNAYSEHQRRWEAELAVVLAERLRTTVDRDPRPGIWSSVAFAVLLHVIHEDVMDAPVGDVGDVFVDRFKYVSELFSTTLP